MLTTPPKGLYEEPIKKKKNKINEKRGLDHEHINRKVDEESVCLRDDGSPDVCDHPSCSDTFVHSIRDYNSISDSNSSTIAHSESESNAYRYLEHAHYNFNISRIYHH